MGVAFIKVECVNQGTLNCAAILSAESYHERMMRVHNIGFKIPQSSGKHNRDRELNRKVCTIEMLECRNPDYIVFINRLIFKCGSNYYHPGLSGDIHR